MGNVDLHVGSRTLRATVDGDRVEIDGKVFGVALAPDGTYIVTDDAQRWRVVVAGGPQDRWIFAEGRVARVEISEGGGGRRRARSAHDMSAPMPATVVKVMVEPGTAVKKGDTLVMLEAMKMELPIQAPRDGVVKNVSCRAGELVQPGTNLLELEP